MFSIENENYFLFSAITTAREVENENIALQAEITELGVSNSRGESETHLAIALQFVYHHVLATNLIEYVHTHTYMCMYVYVYPVTCPMKLKRRSCKRNQDEAEIQRGLKQCVKKVIDNKVRLTNVHCLPSTSNTEIRLDLQSIRNSLRLSI